MRDRQERQAFWNTLIDQITVDLRSEYARTQSASTTNPRADDALLGREGVHLGPLTDSIAKLACDVSQMRTRRHRSAVMRPQKPTVSVRPLSKREPAAPSQTHGTGPNAASSDLQDEARFPMTPETSALFEALRRLGADLRPTEQVRVDRPSPLEQQGKPNPSAAAIVLSRKTLQKERTRLLAKLHPDRTGDIDTALDFQFALESFDRLETLRERD